MEKAWVLSAVAVAVLVFSIGVEGWKGYDVKVVHVGGKVLCQDCSKGWNEWAYGAIPLKGCKVAMTCMDGRGRVVYYTSDATDSHGDFDLTVTKPVNGLKLRPSGCTVRLVSSPNATCDVMTNFGDGETGVRPRRPSLLHPDLVKYVVGPFYFTSRACAEPKAS